MENLQQQEYGFGEVTLQRPMRLFKGSISQAKTYGSPFTPDLDFLVRLVTDYRSHQAILREEAGQHFKNFENHVRGRHKLSPVTLQTVSKKIGMTPETLAPWVHGRQDGPLAPELLKLFCLVEDVPYQFMSHALDTEVRCPCCKKNILDDRDAFWRKQSIAVNAPEYEFADRILSATIGASYFAMLLVNFTEQKIDWDDIYTLSHQCKHPMGHWLTDIQGCLEVASLPDLAAKMQLMSATECHVPYERLRKWSAGMDLMAVSVAKALSNASRRHNWHWTSFFLARALTFVIDFLMAAAPGAKPKRQSIQAIVADRFVGLGQNLRIAMAKRAKASNEKPIQTAT